jgi:tetrahydromethanopterin S-methyltransferase subunit E
MCLEIFGSLIDVGLDKDDYEITVGESTHSFNAIVCNAWNNKCLQRYINSLISGEPRSVELWLVGIRWTEQLLSMYPVRARITAVALTGKRKMELNVGSLTGKC